ncbi:MAG: cyclic nucleotide-binding domain-containing protein [Comamonadaceae bacterium]|nr:MAG: cyclic nucleotide-binding domain-containing protein [Comamonadaceae bacterium]
MRKVLYVLGQLTDSDADWLAGAGRRIRSPQGTRLIDYGVPLDQVFIVLDGEVSIQTAKGFELARIGAGEILGEMSLVDARPPSASAVVAADSWLLVIDKPVLRAKLDADTGFAARFYRAIAIFLSERMRSTVGRMGYGGGADDEAAYDADELDATVLDTVHLAGSRFERMLHKLMG